MTQVTEWAYEYIIGFAAADKAIGKQFVKVMAPFPGDNEDNAFEVMKLVPLGQPDAVPVAYATVCPCKQDFYDFIKATKEGAPFSDPRYDYGKERDITLAQFNALKAAVLFIKTRIRRDLVTNEPVPSPVTVDEFLAGKGYELKAVQEPAA